MTVILLLFKKGPELVIAQPDVNFGLVQLGSCAQSALTLKNFSRVPASWQIHEVGDACDVSILIYLNISKY